ncbi:unnamed protein product, partial [Ectocarpus sp. 12 AP-2014]
AQFVTQVYVGNLSWECQWQDLKDHMRAAGSVKFVDLFQEPGGRSKGCAVVEYETPQEAHSAIRDLHDTELLGRLIFVREDREEVRPGAGSQGREISLVYADHFCANPRMISMPLFVCPRQGPTGSKRMGLHEGAEGRQVHVSNVSWETGWQSLKDHFKQCGRVQFVEIPEDPQGRSKGYATVRFGSEQDAADAINQLDGTDLDGRRIGVREDNRPF